MLPARKFFCALLLISVFSIHSCKKGFETQENLPNNAGDIGGKLSRWLDNQKTVTTKNRSATIELVKDNLDLSATTTKKFNSKSNMLIVPLKNEFKIKKNLDANKFIYLVVFLNVLNEISSGNLILYEAGNDNRPKGLVSDAINDALHLKPIGFDGKFKILDASGVLLNELEFENGRLNATGLQRWKESKPGNNQAGRTSYMEGCWDWYRVTTYYNDYGEVISENWVYLGTTCPGGGPCDDPSIGMYCQQRCNPDDPNSSCDGGGGTDGAECLKMATDNFNFCASQSSPVSEDIASGPATVIDPITRQKPFKWKILNGFGGWGLYSEETGILKLVDVPNNIWNFVSLTHGSISMEGSTLPGVSVSYKLGSAVTTVKELVAGISLSYNVTYSFVCDCPNFPLVGWITPVHKSYNSAKFWNANPI